MSELLPVSDGSIDGSDSSRVKTYKTIGHYYDLAKQAEWQLDDLSWGNAPFIPERTGSPQKQERWRDMWRNVVMQQLQADRKASNMAAQLLTATPSRDIDARLYYTTMVQDEVRHTHAWEKLIAGLGGDGETNPHLDRLCDMVLEADTLEEKIFLMQGFFERIIIPKFRIIQRNTAGTVLGELVTKLIKDDTIHHMSGVSYESELLKGASRRQKAKIVHTAAMALPVYVEFEQWRPSERSVIDRVMAGTDGVRIIKNVEDGKRLGDSLGLDFSEVPTPILHEPSPPVSVSMYGLDKNTELSEI